MNGWAQSVNDLNRRLNPANSQMQYDSQGRPIKKNSGNDSLRHRNPLEDSITIYYRYFDSSRIRHIDSSISDFYTRFPVPPSYVDLGNFGSATHSLFFNPVMKPGWDEGLHAYDIYKYRIEDTKFYQTTRPYTEMGYMLGSKGEQMINILHTQNRKSNLNFVFDYRFINSPGTFKNQNASHNNIRINSVYQSTNKRYGLYFIFINNKLRASENGGIIDDRKLDSLSLNDPFELNTRLGSSAVASRNFFNTNIITGSAYSENIFFLRQSYDFGQKDSLVTDSVTFKLFYPRLRLQHSIKYANYSYAFQDYNAIDSNYLQYFNYSTSKDSILFKDKWSEITNEFSIITYPEKNNLNQFFKVSAAYQLLHGTFDTSINNVSYGSKNLNNIYVSSEYRNRTRNQKWDIETSGLLYMAGNYAGDYAAFISLKRMLSKKLGWLEIGFQNVNRTPSFINQSISAFPVIAEGNYKKENIARLFANVEIPQQNLRLTGNYYLVNNYVYFDSFFTSKQEATLFNVLDIGLEKKIRLNRRFNWYTEIHLQQTTGNAPVHIPFIYTRNRIAFEGNFYKNLFLSTGLEFRYYTSYKADNYSPFNGQFFVQNILSISNRPDLNAYLNFRIKSFKAFVRVENLNTLGKSKNGIGFSKHNFTAPHYPTEGIWVRLGIWWNFVN